MEWSPQQQAALRDVSRWLRAPGQQAVFRLFGWAGTGKTRLAKHLAAHIDGETLFAAFTGKAASVLKASGVPNAQTLHSLIYKPKDRSKERYNDLLKELEDVQSMIDECRMEDQADCGGELPLTWAPPRRLVSRLEQVNNALRLERQTGKKPLFELNLDSALKDAALLVVDEVSMVDEWMAQDILSFGVPVLALGDPGQLPPIKGTGYFTDHAPDIMLTEIHRQAEDNPIIALAKLVREGKPLKLGQYGTSSVIERATAELAMEADQVLVGTNATRIATNKRVRQLLGYQSPLPVDGDKLVCLRNEKDFGLLNGVLYTSLEDATEALGYVNLRVRPEDDPEGIVQTLPAHRQHFDGDPDDIGHWTRRDAQEFTYGYALTTHKAQGSQWGNVMIIDQSQVFKDRDTQRKWLYTAITRAQHTVTVVRQ